MKRAILFLAVAAAACAGPSQRAEPVFPAGSSVLFGLNYAAVPSDDLITGGQPKAATLVGAARAGVKSVVNLRAENETPHPSEVRQWARKSGLAFHHLPIAGPKAVTRENAEKLDKILASAEKPVLVYCGSSNRVGALLALRAFYLYGAPAEDAVRYGKRAGLTRLERRVRRLLAEGALKEGK
jgi:uncharacterized protein (TIGR01244 family)